MTSRPDPEDPLAGGRGPGASLRHALTLRADPDRERKVRALGAWTNAHPTDDLARVLLIQAHGWSGRTDEARTQLQLLIGRAGMDVLAALQQRILHYLGRAGGAIRSEYVCFPDSMVQNVGFWIHRSEGTGGTKEAITKILHTDHVGNERMFYEQIRSAHPGVARISPELVDVRSVDGTPLVLLTLERVSGVPAEPGAMQRDAIDRFTTRYRGLVEVPHATAAPLLGQRITENGLSHGYLARSLHAVHTAEGAARTAQWTRATVQERGYLPVVVRAVLEAMDHLEERAIHQLVDPERHYTLLHGDMHRHNVLIASDRLALIDWARCTTGPRGIDLCVLFRRHGHATLFDLARRHDLFPDAGSVADVLFAWAMIVVSLEIDVDGIKHEDPAHLFLPAAATIRSSLKGG